MKKKVIFAAFLLMSCKKLTMAISQKIINDKIIFTIFNVNFGSFLKKSFCCKLIDFLNFKKYIFFFYKFNKYKEYLY